MWITLTPDEVVWAAAKGETRRLRWFLFVRPDFVNAPDSRGWMPLHCAVMTGQVQTAEVLLRRGADLHAKAHELVRTSRGAVKGAGYTPLQWARRFKRREMARLLSRWEAGAQASAGTRSSP